MTTPSRTTLHVRDRDGSIIGQLAAYMTFDSILRKRDVGTWSLKGVRSDLLEALIEPGFGLQVQYDDDDENPLFSGPMTTSEPSWSEDGDLVVVSGLTDECLLWDRDVWPTKPNFDNNLGQLFAEQAYDVQEGTAESLMKHYVDFNLGDPDREVPGITPVSCATDYKRGGFYIARGRFQKLGDLIQQVAAGGGDLGFSIINRVFEVSEPNDLSDHQIFSVETGNLKAFDVQTSVPGATSVLTAGGDQDVLRTFVLRKDTAAAARWGRNIEEFYDKRDTVDLDELTQAGDQELVDKAEVTTVNLKVIDVRNRTFRRDWNVGDYVTVEDLKAVVNQAQLTLDENGRTVTPTVDSVTSVTAQSVLRIFDRMRALNRRINNLERAN